MEAPTTMKLPTSRWMSPCIILGLAAICPSLVLVKAYLSGVVDWQRPCYPEESLTSIQVLD